METYLPRHGPARLAGDGKGVASMSFVDAPTREAFPDGHIPPIVDEVDVPPSAVPLWPILRLREAAASGMRRGRLNSNPSSEVLGTSGPPVTVGGGQPAPEPVVRRSLPVGGADEGAAHLRGTQGGTGLLLHHRVANGLTQSRETGGQQGHALLLPVQSRRHFIRRRDPHQVAAPVCKRRR